MLTTAERRLIPSSFRFAIWVVAVAELFYHFSEPLNQITKNCGFKGYQLAMYTDRDGYAKDLPDNAVGTILYGRGYEIRGAVIIALEDNRYDTYSFHFQETLTKSSMK